jgi:hypothetical protein
MKTTTYSAKEEEEEEEGEQQQNGSSSDKFRLKLGIYSSSIEMTVVSSSRIVVIIAIIIIVAAVSSSSSSSSRIIIHYLKNKLSIPIIISNNQPCISAFRVMMNTSTSTSSNDNDDEVMIDSMDRALSMIQNNYPEEYYHSTISHHHFVQTASPSIREVISNFVWTNSIKKQLQKELETSAAAVIDSSSSSSNNNNDMPMNMMMIPDVFDEIYIMREEFDIISSSSSSSSKKPKKVHYDGNLKLPGICTIRSLTYLTGYDATLFAITSQQNYTTNDYSTIILDFNRELHYVSTQLDNNIDLDDDINQKLQQQQQQQQLNDNCIHTQRQNPRVMIKSAMHIIVPGTPNWIIAVHITLHRIMVFGARCFRRTFESSSTISYDSNNNESKSNNNDNNNNNNNNNKDNKKLCMMMVDNIIRELNKIHMVLPLVVIAIPLVVLYLMPLYYYTLQVIPYCIYIIVQVRCLSDNDLMMKVMITVWMVVLISRSYYYWSQEEKMNRTTVMRSSTTSSLLLVRRIFRFLILHIAWVGLCYFININAEMANEILLAPWQESILLDNK